MTPITPWQCLHRIARRNRGWVKEALDGAAAGAINKASTSTRAGDKDSFKPNILRFLEEHLHPSEKGLKNLMAALRHRNKLRSVFALSATEQCLWGQHRYSGSFARGHVATVKEQEDSNHTCRLGYL